MRKSGANAVAGAALLLAVLVLAGHVKNLYFGGSAARNYCTIEQRQAEYCIALYEPVCGWFDSSKIQCFAYPCAGTYSNSCFACMDEKVLYWTAGECPK